MMPSPTPTPTPTADLRLDAWRHTGAGGDQPRHSNLGAFSRTPHDGQHDRFLVVLAG
ncbi:MAG: hypothetical protein IPO15_26950 [Anaerolineae bacterium]|uniref:hypothetical protein n=1 Tax=Candidatus Amarolinea dominans TaxID=3140696 RepID=UPI003136AE0D|nr:hypothetical protein [Anaerolineae bacterium]